MYVVATMHDQGYRSLSQVTCDNNKVPYCELHGYELAVKTDEWSDVIYFDKIQFLIDILENNPDVKWIWWLDTDALITNFTKKIEDYVDDQYHIIMSTDVNGMNCGSFFIKNSPEALEWLRMILDHKERYKLKRWDNPEQTPMIMTYIKYKDWIKLVPQKEINSYNYGLLYPTLSNKDMLGVVGEWAPGDWVLHWPGISNPQRIQIAQQVALQIVYPQEYK
jgi:hypothetical protein